MYLSFSLIRRFTRAAFVAFLVTASSGVDAGLIDNGTLTRDTNTGLDWLDMSFTQAKSAQAVLFNPGAIRPGFRGGTAAEVVTLLAGVGLAPGVQGLGAAPAADLLITFLGETHRRPFGNSTLIFTEGVSATPGSISGRNLAYEVRLDVGQNGELFSGRVLERQRGTSSASAEQGIFLVQSVANGTPDNAVAPSSAGQGVNSFSASLGGGAWFETPNTASGGVQVESDGNSLITHVALSSDFSDGDGFVTLLDLILGEVEIGPGDVHQLSTPVESLSISGIGTPLSSSSPLAASSTLSFPLFLQFDQSSVSFDISASIPEPSSFLLLGLGALSVSVVKARRR